MSDIYLSITETPTVVTLTNPLISSNVAQSVTVTNVVSVNVVTMPAINVTAAAPAVTTVAGTVSISNFPSTQTIAGTVTANLFAYDAPNDEARKLQIADTGIGLIVAGSTNVNDNPVIISGTVTANVPFASTTATFPSQLVALGFQDANTGNIVPVTNDAEAGLPAFVKNISVEGNPNAVFPSWLDGITPTDVPISGTVTANANYEFEAGGSGQPNNAIQIGYYKGLVFEPVTEEDPLPISGTVTVGGFSSVSVGSGALLIGGLRGGSVVGLPLDSGSGNVSVQLRQTATTTNEPISQSNPLWVTQQGSVTIGSLPAISGTVTANNPSGALTTRFGSVTTANTAQITSAVTNTSRKYLLAQNISAGTVTIGIGFSPTTTQGIQLTAGGGLTFDSFCPTGAVYWLGAVTGAAFTILEG